VAAYRVALRRFLRFLRLLAAARPGADCAALDHALADAYLTYLRGGHRTAGGAPAATAPSTTTSPS
jgi:hypothetical protein